MRAGIEESRHQRASGQVQIRFSAAPGGRTALADLFQCAPCRALFPCSEPGNLTQAVLLTTTGGLTGGDRIRIDMRLDERARASVTTQAAEKIYRALPSEEPVYIDAHFRLGHGSWGEWLAQETILFADARLHRRLEADVAIRA
jgi:urease accessory protein